MASDPPAIAGRHNIDAPAPAPVGEAGAVVIGKELDKPFVPRPAPSLKDLPELQTGDPENELVYADNERDEHRSDAIAYGMGQTEGAGSRLLNVGARVESHQLEEQRAHEMAAIERRLTRDQMADVIAARDRIRAERDQSQGNVRRLREELDTSRRQLRGAMNTLETLRKEFHARGDALEAARLMIADQGSKLKLFELTKRRSRRK